MAKTGQVSDDRQHEFVRSDAANEIKEAGWDELRSALKSKGYRVEDMDQSAVVDTAVREGLLDQSQMEASWDASHPGPVDPANPPKGLPSDDLEPSSAEMFEDMIVRDVAEAEGLDRNSDVETQAEHLLATDFGKQREVAEAVTGLDSTSGDDELRTEVANVTARTLVGRPDSPLDRATLEMHADGESRHHDDTMREELVREHGYEEWQVESRSGEELQNLLDWHANNPGSDATDGQEAAGGPDASAVPRNASPEVGTNHVDGDGVERRSTDSSTSDSSTTVPSTTDPSSTGQSSATGSSSSEGTPVSPSESQESETVTWVFSTGGEYFLGDNGKWYNSAHQEVTNPETISMLEELHDHHHLTGGFDEPIETFESQGTEPSDAPSELSNEADPNSEGNDESTDSEGGDDDDSGDDDDGDDDDDSSDDSSSDDDEASTDDSSGETDEQSDSTAGGDEGLPGPDGHDPIDPADQARFDASPFGQQQRQSEIDHIEGRIGVVGSPDDGPTDTEEADFMLTEAGAEQLEDLTEGVENNRSGGDTDPADLDAEESNGPVNEVAAAGGGVIDPSEDSPEVGTRNGGIEGIPESIAGAPPVAGPVGEQRKEDAFGEGASNEVKVDTWAPTTGEAERNGDGAGAADMDATGSHVSVVTDEPVAWVEEEDASAVELDRAVMDVELETEITAEIEVVE